MRLKYDIRNDAENLDFVETDGKIFVRDFHGLAMTAPIALNESNSNYKCTQIGDIEKISAERATEIVKSTGSRLIYGKVEQGADCQLKDFGIVV